MEDLGLKLFNDAYRGRRVLVTGHTGFKGSWLALWLTRMGAEVTGIALAPDANPNHWDLLGLDIEDIRIDIRDSVSLAAAVKHSAPEIVFHLAAQSLVRRSYADPVTTWATNLGGTTHVLEAARATPFIRAVIVVTTDKVYEESVAAQGCREPDRLGGHDPYSASKAACELLVDSYRRSYSSAPGAPLLATARAGNVIGGGDWGEDRLVPDLARSVASGSPLRVRHPNAIRPWQHVLDCLAGYLMLGERLLDGDRAFATSWNIGPDTSSEQPVEKVLRLLESSWSDLVWSVESEPEAVHEAPSLRLNTAKLRAATGWRPVWNLERATDATAAWYRSYLETGEILTSNQIESFTKDAAAAELSWTTGP